MARLILADEAKEDLVSIRQYTKKTWGLNQSKSYIAALRLSLRQLLENPFIGVDRSLDLGESVCSFPQGSHMIYYQRNGEDIVVLSILHQNMMPARHLNLDA